MKHPPKPPRHSLRDLGPIIRRQPAVFAVYLVLRLIVIGTLVSSIIRQEYESAFICLLVLVLFMLPFFIQQNFGIELPSTLEIIILLFIFAAEILGELGCYFITYPHWDSMLHTTTGFLCAATGFALIDILNRNSRIKFQLSPVYVALAAFCFSMTVGVLWEFFEFGMDQQQHPRHHRRYHLRGRQRPGPGLRRVSGHWPVRHHGGPVRKLHRRRGVQHHRILLYQAPGPGKDRPGLYPHHHRGGFSVAGAPGSAGCSPGINRIAKWEGQSSPQHKTPSAAAEGVLSLYCTKYTSSCAHSMVTMGITMGLRLVCLNR